MQDSHTPAVADETLHEPGGLRLISASTAGLPAALAERVDGHLATFAAHLTGHDNNDARDGHAGGADGSLALLASSMPAGADPWGRSTPLHAAGPAIIVHLGSGRALIRWRQRLRK
jgi:hypothetical protein